MRDDMFKVIVERPRRGVRGAQRIKLRHEKTGKSFIGMKRQSGLQGGYKQLNENLAPLRRYLHRQVGRRWDDVYSDICASLDTGGTVKMHVRDHIDDFVERCVRVERSGEWVSIDPTWGSRRGISRWSSLYVDPADGVLKKTCDLLAMLGVSKERYFYTQQREIKGRVVLNKTEELRRIQGVWYSVEFKNVWRDDMPKITEPGVQYLEAPHRHFHNRWSRTRLPNQWRLVAGKRQLSKKELKSYGLKRGADVH